MAKLGSPVTNKFSIGTAEVRVGPLSSANKLTQAHSIGLVDNATVEVTQNSVDLLGGFPQTIVDTAIVSQETRLTATLREYSKRNLAVMMGAGISSYVADVASLVVTSVALGGVSFDVTATEGANFSAGDIVSIYPAGRPEELTIALVDGVVTDTVTLDANTPTLFAYDGTAETIHIFKSQPTAIGAVTSTNYFSVQMIQQDREFGRPVAFNFWKGAIGAGMTLSSNATDFASTELNVKLLQPAATEYGVGGDLAHLADIIPTYPVGMYAAGGDT